MTKGRHSYGNPKIWKWESNAELHIGSFTSIAAGVTVFLGYGSHRPDWVTTFPFAAPELAHLWNQDASRKDQYYSKGDVVIGSDVWIGDSATIMSGVTIGDGAIIGARSVVTKDIPPYAVAAGNPADVVKFRFTPDIIENLLDIKWWEWDDEKIKRHLPLLMSSNIESFIKSALEDK